MITVDDLRNEARHRHAVNLEGDPIRFRDAKVEDDSRWQAAARIETLEAALTLAEDVLSRAPFSTAIWPNGMHPNTGIEKIRAALVNQQSTMPGKS